MKLVRIRSSRPALVTGGVLCLFATSGLATTEIFVTARKREENLQTVPIAIEAIGAAEIERRGIADLDSVLRQSASLILDQGFSPQDQRVVIRGLSPTRGRQNVAVLVDDIDVSSEAVTTAGGSLLITPRLIDIERVEVLKGPQNALYGRAAFAGAINYITRRPGDSLEGAVGTDIGSDGKLEVSGRLSGPLADGIRGGVTAVAWNHDGYYRNSVTGKEIGGQDGTSLSGTLLFDLSESLTARLRVEHLDDEFEVTPYTIMDYNATFTVPANAPVSLSPGAVRNGVRGKVPDGDDLSAFVSEDPRTCADPSIAASAQGGCDDYAGTDRRITRATLTFDWDLGAMSLKSLTHFATADTSQREGAFGVSATESSAVGENFYDDDTDLFSQELRLVSNGDGPLTWAAGALFWKEDSESRDGAHTCLNYTGFPFLEPCGEALAAIREVDPQNPPAGIVPLNPDRRFRDTEHWSIYGLVEWQFLDDWKLSFEARQTWEDLRAGGPDQDNGIWDPSGFVCTFFGAPPCPQIGPGTFPPGSAGSTVVAGVTVGEQDDDFFAPKATLTWQATANQLWYFSWAKAYKPKGITLVNAGTGVFDPEVSKFDQEKLMVWELGAKTDWFDRTVQVNGALFFQDFKNKQVSTQRPTSSVPPVLTGQTVNAGEAEVWGVELDVNWLATDNLTMYFSGTWLDTEYKKYDVFSTNGVKAAYIGNCNPPFSVLGRDGCTLDLSGHELEDAPELAFVAGGRYQRTLAGATDWFVEGDVQYQDERFEADDNLLVFPSYWLANFRLGITNDAWDIVAYVDNAFDDDTVKTGFSNGSTPNFQLTGLFENQGILILPDQRQFGLRVNYRFGN